MTEIPYISSFFLTLVSMSTVKSNQTVFPQLSDMAGRSGRRSLSLDTSQLEADIEDHTHSRSLEQYLKAHLDQCLDTVSSWFYF